MASDIRKDDCVLCDDGCGYCLVHRACHFFEPCRHPDAKNGFCVRVDEGQECWTSCAWASEQRSADE